MKLFFAAAIAALTLASCSKGTDNPTGASASFTFDVPAPVANSGMRDSVDKAFFKRYALLDTSKVVSGRVTGVQLIAFDSVTQQTTCATGYLAMVNEDPKRSPDAAGDYFGSPAKVFFFTGTGGHFEVWNNPIVTQGTVEEATEKLMTEFISPGNSGCGLFGLRIERPIPTAGITVDDRITFYYWSESEHALKPVFKSTVAYRQISDAKPVDIRGQVQLLKTGNGPGDLRYTLSADSTYTEYYVWNNGHYVPEHRPQEQSQYRLQLDSMKGARYPFFRSVTDHDAADRINRELQLQDFGVRISDGDDLLTGMEDGQQTVDWRFLFSRVNNRLVHVTTVKTHRAQNLYTSGFSQHYFDGWSGELIAWWEIFDEDKYDDFGAKITRMLQEASHHACDDYIAGAWKDGRIIIDMKPMKRTFVFRTQDCEGDTNGPPSLNMISATAPWSAFDGYMKDYFYYLMDGNPVAEKSDDPYAGTWYGRYAEDDVLMIVLKSRHGDADYTEGYIIYYPSDILKRVQAHNTETGFLIEELGKDGAVTATINVTLKDDKLKGLFGKIPFEAQRGGW